MTEYYVTYYVKLAAKSKKDLERKAETVGNAMSKCLKKTVYPHGFVEVENATRPKQEVK